MLSESLRRKLLWMIGGRAAVITVLLGSAILIQLRGSGSFPTDPFFALIGLTYGLTVVWALTLRFVDRAPWLIEVQLACDALIVSAIVHLSGGVASYLSSLYTLPIIAASTLQSWRGGLRVSVLSVLLYAGLVIAQYQGAPLRETNVFPSMVVQMINVGETTGALDAMLGKIADFYEEEVDTAVAGLLTLMEPLMIAVLGGIVGGIVIAMYMPIFDLISKLT